MIGATNKDIAELAIAEIESRSRVQALRQVLVMVNGINDKRDSYDDGGFNWACHLICDEIEAMIAKAVLVQAFSKDWCDK